LLTRLWTWTWALRRPMQRRTRISKCAAVGVCGGRMWRRGFGEKKSLGLDTPSRPPNDAQPRCATPPNLARRRETLKQHHSWFVQKTVGVALMSLGSRKDVFNRVREKDMSDDKVVEHAKSVPGDSGAGALCQLGAPESLSLPSLAPVSRSRLAHRPVMTRMMAQVFSFLFSHVPIPHPAPPFPIPFNPPGASGSSWLSCG
jgi:hypothetical protein